MGGLTVLGAGTFPISVFRMVSKLLDFITLLDICFLNTGSNFESMTYKMNYDFFATCKRGVKWSLWNANDFCVVGGWAALQFCAFDLHTQECPP